MIPKKLIDEFLTILDDEGIIVDFKIHHIPEDGMLKIKMGKEMSIYHYDNKLRFNKRNDSNNYYLDEKLINLWNDTTKDKLTKLEGLEKLQNKI